MLYRYTSHTIKKPPSQLWFRLARVSNIPLIPFANAALKTFKTNAYHITCFYHPQLRHFSTQALPETTPANVMLAQILEVSSLAEQTLDLVIDVELRLLLEVPTR